MKKITGLLVLLLVFVGCGEEPIIDITCVKVVGTSENPFMQDHCRQLMIIDKEKKIIDQTDLFCDSDRRCKAFLFDNDDSFTFADCNGTWFEINKYTGTIAVLKKERGIALAEHYVGTYIKHLGSVEYSFVMEEDAEVNKVIKYIDNQ